MISLALIGKGISHSNSKEMYENILNQKIYYDLLDCPSEKDLPELKDIEGRYLGINITSPYKRYYFDKVNVEDDLRSLGAINCIKNEMGKWYGTNTDFLALLDIFESFKNEYRSLYVIILGDGVMSAITQKILTIKNIEFEVASRKKNLYLVDFKINQNLLRDYEKILMVNACSREFVYRGKLNDNVLFYDYNYDFGPHINHFYAQKTDYVDGKDLLKRQAIYTLEFLKLLK